MTRKLLFENVTCSRCGGSGEYSYCSMYGRVCFKCGGSGATLTKKGRVAQNWLNAKRKFKAGDLKVGDRYFYEGIPGFSRTEKVTVTGFEPDPLNGGMTVMAVNEAGKTFRMGTEIEVRKVLTIEAARALRAEAVAFQATLTKTGTVRKRTATKMKEAA